MARRYKEHSSGGQRDPPLLSRIFSDGSIAAEAASAVVQSPFSVVNDGTQHPAIVSFSLLSGT